MWFVTKQTIGETVPETVLFKVRESCHLHTLKNSTMHRYTIYQLHLWSFKLGLWLTARTLKANHLSAPLSLQVDYTGLPWDLRADYLGLPAMGYESRQSSLPRNLRAVFLGLPWTLRADWLGLPWTLRADCLGLPSTMRTDHLGLHRF